jgi:short-subunit dehydrogenase
MRPYEGKNIWIIGASSGIGRALAVELAAQGARLVLSARSEDKLEALSQELGGEHKVLPLDVRNSDAFVKNAKTIQETLHKLDSMIFMAAVYTPKSKDPMDIDKAMAMVDINFKGTINAVHAILPIFKAQKSGQIALCGSVAGYRGLPYSQPYGATKAAVISLAESLKLENKELDIKVINPGFVRTPMTDKNDFKMPMIIEPEEAAKIIARDLQKKRFEIHFPKRFTFLAKLLALLPSFLYFKIMSRI